MTKKSSTLATENMATVEYQKLWYMLRDKYKCRYKINASYCFLIKCDAR